ncbi:MAG: FtsH protease activity modulator HflK [Azospirillum sp.]|nr:FtsH protease activity modulator HflK [Azospirillum sp.]
MANGKSPWDKNDDDFFQENEKIIRFKKITVPNNGNFNINPLWWFLLAIALWLSTGFYQVQTNENGVVLRFGKYVDTTEPGLHYHLPYPIEEVIKVSMTQERSINLGVNDGNYAKNYRDNSFTESHMLTGDENIVDINLTIVWRIKNAKDFLFNMREPETTVRVAAQSVLREIVGQSEMMPIISGDRGKVEDDTKAELQRVLDDFGSGVEIVRVKLQKADPPQQVVDAFNEVQRAKADMERFKNEAEAYRNEVVPNAHGQASQILQSAEAYNQAVVNKATGEADRFNSVYQAYKKGKEVTIRRLYLETMENVLKKSDKVIVDPSAKGSNVLPVLPLNAVK